MVRIVDILELKKILLLMMCLICLPMFSVSTEVANTTSTFLSRLAKYQDSLQPPKVSKDPFINRLLSKTYRHDAYNPIEKVFLHTDKDMFSKGETIWYSAYVVTGASHQFTKGSKVVHVDLIGPNGEIVVSQTHELIDGKGSGALEIPKNSPEGSYQLRSYTQWMRNFDAAFFFTKNLNVISKGNQPNISQMTGDAIDLQFFPEGGHLVAGITSKVSFKAIGSDGLPVPVKGKILNAYGSVIAHLTTFDRGSGFFQLTPKKGENYYAELESGVQYSLPEIQDQGYVLTINNRNQKNIKVTVAVSDSLRYNPVYLVGHMRQSNYFHRKFKFDRDQTLQFEIAKANLPNGILTLTLFDIKNNPWCERPVFIYNEKALVINTKIHSNKLVKRGKVTVEINTTNFHGKPKATHLSLAVTDAGQIEKSEGSGTILSHFLLESDIKGTVTSPGSLFKNRDIKTLQQLDLVMLTNGWRKYDWSEVWKDVQPEKEFPFAQGLTISGTAFNTKYKPMPNARLNVMAKSGDILEMYSVKTDLDGRFEIPNFNLGGDTQIVFNAYNHKEKKVNVKATLDAHKIKAPHVQFKNAVLKQTSSAVDAYKLHSVNRDRMEALLRSYGVTELDEVVVTEKKKKESRNQSPSTLGITPDATLYTEDYNFETVSELLQLFPGVVVWHGPRSSTISIRNGGPPLFILDGVPRADLGGEGGQIRWMSTLDIERVELLRGPRAAYWGARGANGVFLIYTKRGGGRTYDPVLSPEFKITGHAPRKEFYSPKYAIRKEEHKIPDYRATLYWNPHIKTDEKGNATIEFFNSDSAKEIQLSIEGVSSDGTMGSYLQTFSENEIFPFTSQ